MNNTNRVQLLRNIGFIAHIDAGKTTVTEEILHRCSVTHKIGRVDDGTTVTDYMVQERERGITIVSAVVSCPWKEWTLNIIDTPGHIDFTAEVERSLRVLDGAIIIFDATVGVQPQSETVWRQANRYSVPRICFINKMDRPDADFKHAMRTIQERLGANPVAIQMPVGNESGFRGVIDLIQGRYFHYAQEGLHFEIIEIPEILQEEFRSWQTLLFEKIAECDDEFLLKYFAEEITPQETISALRRATLKRFLFPVLCGAALRHKGIEPLLDAIGLYLPSPCDLSPQKGIDPLTGKTVCFETKENSPFSALAFKVVTDPFIGRIVYFRVYSGTAKSGGAVYNATKDLPERFGRLLRIHAGQREEIQEVSVGDIAGAVGLKQTLSGHTLCEKNHRLLFEKIVFPEPVFSVSVEAKTNADQDKLANGLAKLIHEDPTLTLRYDEETGQTILSGMGELHLEIVADRLRHEFDVETIIGRPQVAYRETITKTSRVEGRFIRQSGGRGQYGHVWLGFEPLEPGSGIVFENHIVGGLIPQEYVPAVKKGVEEALQNGVLAGYPIIDIKVTLVDGSYHAVDSSELAFKMAAAIAVKKGAQEACPVLLEPIMNLEVICPSEFLGEVIGDLNGRRAQITGLEEQGQCKLIKAEVPLAEMFGYTTPLRSLTQGRASHAMEFKKFERTPENVAAEVIKRSQTN